MSSHPGALSVTTGELPDPAPLLSMLPSPRGALSWLREGEGLVGWGEASRFTARGPGRFTQARRRWRELTARLRVRDELGIPGTGPVAFGSMAFADDPGDSVLIMPRVVVGRRDGISWITTIGGPAAAPKPVTAPGTVCYRAGAVNDAAHRRSVAAAVARIWAGELAKVVLARDLLA